MGNVVVVLLSIFTERLVIDDDETKDSLNKEKFK